MFWEEMLQFLCDEQCYVYAINILKKKKNEKENSRNQLESSDWLTENRAENLCYTG